ncbi:DUF6270 domain-containing protein [Neobacillus cucumis]|uniref:DUF6270 domain-containing protein n=1 Tax=Neobacillus cucumis TaxID=1740721 RepID=UPI002E216508|nr:DUF6270 domain-containing protein [Neobacillus cucumis]
MFQINKLEMNEGKLHFLFSAKTGDDPIEVCFGLRDNERWGLLERHQELLLVPEKHHSDYELTVNIFEVISHFQNLSGKRNVIDILIKHNHKYHRIYIKPDMVDYINGKQSITITPLLNLKYYVISQETLGIQVLAKNIKPILKNLQLSNDKVHLQIATLLNNDTSNLAGHKLFVKQRSVANTTQTYNEWESVYEDKSNSFTLNANILSGFRLGEKEIFDLFFEYQSGNFSIQVPLNIGDIQMGVKKWCQLEDIFEVALVKGVTGNLSIRTIRKELSVTVDAIALDEDYLTINLQEPFASSEFSNIKFQIRSYLTGMENKDTVLHYEKAVPKDLKISVNLKEIFGDFSSNFKRTYKIFIECNNQLYKLTKLDFQESLTFDNISVQISFDDTLVLETMIIDTRPIPIAVMGSCFSRSSFNSDDYFNPDYKKYFKVSFSYFWPSVMGLASAPLPYDPDWFTDLPAKKLHEIEWEFLKNWDKDLRDSGAEYLLLDFFVDAMHGVLQFGPNQYLTRNLYTRKTGYYHTNLLKEGKTVDCFQPGYFELWTKSFDLFVEKILDIIPEEKIVLNLSLLTDRFYGRDGGISSFFDSKHITKSRFIHVNHIWTKMNNYFLAKLPNAKVIDMLRFGYIGDADAPEDLAKLGPHHFETGYYKSVVSELNKLISIDSRMPKPSKIGR